MANIKFSQFTPKNDLVDWDGIVGFESTALSGNTDDNYFITPANLITYIGNNISIGANKITSGILPISRGGTGLSPAAPGDVPGVPFVGALINEASQVVGDTLAFDVNPNNPNASVLVAQKPSKGVPFSFSVVVNRPVGPAGYYTMNWNTAGWEYGANAGLLKYTQTAANPLIRKKLFNEEQVTDLEITWGMSGVINTNYNWELRLEDPNGVVPALVLTNAAQAGFFNTIVSFDGGGSTWGVGWMQARVTNISLAAFFGAGLATEGELNLYVEGPQTYANVGCDVRFFSP